MLNIYLEKLFKEKYTYNIDIYIYAYYRSTKKSNL